MVHWSSFEELKLSFAMQFVFNPPCVHISCGTATWCCVIAMADFSVLHGTLLHFILVICSRWPFVVMRTFHSVWRRMSWKLCAICQGSGVAPHNVNGCFLKRQFPVIEKQHPSFSGRPTISLSLKNRSSEISWMTQNEDNQQQLV